MIGIDKRKADYKILGKILSPSDMKRFLSPVPKKGEVMRKQDLEYLNPAPEIESLTYQYPFDNEYEIFTLRKDLQPTSPPGQLQTWNNKRSNENPGGTMTFYTTDTKFFSLLFEPIKVVETGCAAIVEMNYTLDQNWPLSFGFTPIARKRQFSLIMQNHGISIIADLYVPEKFADLNLIGIPNGYGAFATRGHSNNIKHLEVRYKRALNIAKKGEYRITENILKAIERTRVPVPLREGLSPLLDKGFESEKKFTDAVENTTYLSFRKPELKIICDACMCGCLNCFLVYGGGEKVRQWVIERNKEMDVPHIWWYPDAMDVIRVNRKKGIVEPI